MFGAKTMRKGFSLFKRLVSTKSMTQTPTPKEKKEEICPKSRRVDGRGHSFVFDGDDPYVVCAYCGECRDAISGCLIPKRMPNLPPKENKTLADFLNNEQKMFLEHVDFDYIFKDWLSSHDARLLAFVREMVKETMDSSDLREKWLKELDTTLTPPTKV